MDDTVLHNLPKAMANPIMILKGNIQNDPVRKVKDSYVFALSVQDKNGANVIVPVHVGKEFIRDRHKNTPAVVVDIAISAYGKGYEGTNYTWFINQLKQKNAVYINQQKSVAWTTAIRGASLWDRI